MKIDISKLGYRWKGNYSSSATYIKGDVVRKDGKVVSWTGTAWKQMAADQQNATVRGEMATPDANQTLTGVEGQDLYVTADGTLEWRWTEGRKITAATKLPEMRFGGDCNSWGGQQQMCIMTDGTVRAWGRNNNGALGDGIDADRHRSIPTQVAFPPGTPPIVKMWRGWYNTFAADAQGRLWAWGYNAYGHLGANNGTSNVLLPRLVSGQGDLPLNDTVVDVHVGTGYYGYYQTLIRTSNGRVYHCGSNRYAAAGTGDGNDHYTPKLVLKSLDVEVVNMFAFGHYHAATFLLDAQGRLWASGETNTIGRIRNNDNPNALHELWQPSVDDPVKVVYGEESDEHVNAGSQYYRQYMIISQAGNLYSWGHGSTYSSGTNNISDQSYGTTETWVPKLDSRISNVVDGGVGAGWYHQALALKSDGTLWGIGNNQDGVLGTYGGTNSTWGQVNPGNLNLEFAAIYMRGGRHGKSCAGVTKNGEVTVWGMNGHGASGTGYTSDQPQSVARLPGRIDMSNHRELFNYTGSTDDADTYQFCHAITGNGNVYGWGLNNWAQIGADDDQEDVLTPTPVLL